MTLAVLFIAGDHTELFRFAIEGAMWLIPAYIFLWHFWPWYLTFSEPSIHHMEDPLFPHGYDYGCIPVPPKRRWAGIGLILLFVGLGQLVSYLKLPAVDLIPTLLGSLMGFTLAVVQKITFKRVDDAHGSF
jgi:hypothetical protein